MTTSLAELERWLSVPREDEHLEFKEAKAQYDSTKAVRYCVALANEGGGKLVLGVTDKPPRRVVGSQAFANKQAIAELVLQKARFRVDVEEITHPDGRVVVLHAPPRPVGTAYSFEGAYLMRSGEQLVPMSEDRLRAIFAEGKPSWALQSARSGCSADEVVTLLDTQSYFDLRELAYPSAREGVIERLEQDKIVTRSGSNWAVTNLGAVLLAKKLSAFDNVARKGPRVVVYEGTSKLQTKLDQPGTKGYAVGFAELLDFVNAQVPSNEVIEKALRRQVKMFPEIALRELVANALIHQDFEQPGGSVMIELYSDRIEISNPGEPTVPLERFIDAYQSRNEHVADLMRRLRICEEKGSGVDKVIAAVEAHQLPAPDFRVGPGRTTAVMFAHKPLADMDREERVRAAYQHCCLRYVMNEEMTNQTLRARFQASSSKTETVSRIIRDAVDAQRIKRADPQNRSKRFARYVPFWA